MDTLDDWPSIARRMVIITTAGQLGSAKQAAQYVTSNVGSGVGTINPLAFASVASDLDNLVYEPLDSYLYGAVAHARSLYGSGLSDAEIMKSGSDRLALLVRSQVADAARNAIGALIASTPRAHFYRVIQPPCCMRCALLRDQTFAWNSTFRRHPRCDCMQGPILSEDQAKFSHVEPGDVTDLTIAQRKAIADGADMNQVINAKRAGAVQRVDIGGRMVKITTEGTTKRSWNAYVQKEIARQKGEDLKYTTEQVGRRGAVASYTVSRVKPRLTPEAIYQFAGTREEAVRLLARNGYIVGDLNDVLRLAS